MYKELKTLNSAVMGNRIRKIREARKMTREILAEKIDVSVNFISDIEYGKKCPSIRTFYFLCQALGITADYLLTGNAHASEFNEEASEIREEILSILTKCDKRQLKSLRDISVIYVDIVKK